MDSPVVTSPVPPSALLLRLRRLVRPFVWMVLVLSLYAGLGFIGVPLLAGHYAPQLLGDQLGRLVSIEKTAFNPFTFAVELRGLKVMESMESGGEDGAAALTFDRLMVNFGIKSLWYGGPVVQELELNGPHVRLVRLAEGRYNWSDVFDRLAAPSDDPLSFSVANIHVSGGMLEIEDRVTNATHRVSNLKLGIPAVSRELPVAADVFIEPDLSMLVDERPLAAKGELKLLPGGFEGRLEQLAIKDFELPPWMAYLPFEPSFRLPSGALDLDLRVIFSQHENKVAEVTIQGWAQVNRLAVQDRAGKPVLAVAELEVELAEVKPFSGRYHFSRLRLQQPELDLARAPDGSFNLESLLPTGSPNKAGARASARKEAPLEFQLSSARIRDGLVRYSDHAVAGGFSTRLEGITLDLRDLASNRQQIPAEIRLDYKTASGESFSHQDRLRLQPFEYDGNLTVKGLQPALYGQYYGAFLSGGEIRRGSVNGIFHYRVASQDKKDAGNELQVEAGIERLDISEFVFGLQGRKGELLKLRNLTLTDGVIQPGAQQARIGEINAQGVALEATRFADGRFDFMALAGTSSGKKASPPWTFSLGKAGISNSALRFEDRATGGQPAVVTADDIELQLSGLTTAKGAAPTNLSLRGKIGKEGRLALKGTFVPEPFRTDFDLDLQNFALPLLQPYLAQHAQLDIRAGQFSAKGRLSFRQHRESMYGSLAGQLTVRNFDSFDRINSQDFLRWNEFAVHQAKVELEPFSFSVGEVAVDGLASRLILDEKGRLNLREIQRSTEELAQSDNAVAAVEGAENTVAESPLPWKSMKVDRIVLKNSNIAFSDRFVRPNYNAFLGNLSGELTGLSSDQGAVAKLDVHARIGRSAPVMIRGEISPFSQDRRLDIEAQVKDFDLHGLSGYSGRYIGYGIARGKLSATLNYRIEDRKLAAENHVFLDQLTFGDAVDSPEATHLPVRLAVSLLKNSRGEIDLHLPVGGTLDDPQFSVFGLVLRAFVGLISKAITSPFALFGQEELSQLDFDAGSFQIGEAQEKKLRELAKSLEDRPSLKLDITGQADIRRDIEGVRYNKLRNMVRAERRRASKAPLAGEADPEGEEYADLLEAVYKQAKIKKPRNFVGLTKSLPVEEMEKLLMESIDVKQEDVDILASRREATVQRWLVDQGGIAPDRLFRRALTDAEAKESGREGNGVRFFLR